MGRKLFGSLALLTLLVSLMTLARPVVAGSPPVPDRESGFCDEMGFWCSVGADGSLHCEASGQCESEGDRDRRETEGQICVPGSRFSYLICDEGQRCTYVCNDAGQWESWGCIPVYDVCVDDLVCLTPSGSYEPTCWTPETREDSETPCEDLDWGTAGIQCLGEYGLDVSVTVPCQRVGRIPYPRGMVVVPNRMWIDANSPAWVESWSQTLDYNACLSHDIKEDDRLIRNFRIGLAWERIDDMPPYWKVEESGTYRGWSVGGIAWERSSWGKPRCGPGLQQGERLPAYRVDVYTYWQAYWRRVYDRQKKFEECESDWRCDAWGQCNTVCDIDGDGHADSGTKWETYLCNTDENEDGIPDDECWEEVDSGWQPFDLRMFGYPTSYFVSSAAGPIPTALEPNPGCSGVCVPVIEVQGLIRNPRGQ